MVKVTGGNFAGVGFGRFPGSAEVPAPRETLAYFCTWFLAATYPRFTPESLHVSRVSGFLVRWRPGDGSLGRGDDAPGEVPGNLRGSSASEITVTWIEKQLIGFATAGSKHQCPKNAPTVTLQNGALCGEALPQFSQSAYLGIPFAQPPVGNLRLRHPEPFTGNYGGPRDATKQPPNCPGYAGFEVGIGPLSEDSLCLNVIVPDVAKGGKFSEAKNQKLPVLVWIYGGGFDAGGIADPRYNMSYIVSNSVSIGKSIIAVAINYRVGGWGFLASKEVLKDGSANIGLYDQRMAMAWIQDNIDRFGGDKAKVTIWGESAGAFSIGYHLTAFNGDNSHNPRGGKKTIRKERLFRAAIMDSGTMLGQPVQDANTLQDKGGFQEQYDNVTKTVGCDTAKDSLQCLREVPYATLFKAFEPQVYTPIVDGTIISRPPHESVAKGLTSNVAIMAGANTDEGTASFWGPRGTLNTTEDVREFVQSLNGGGLSAGDVEELLQLYPDDPAQGCPYNTGSERFADQGWMYKRGAAISGDINVHAGRRGVAKHFASKKKALPVYSYRFDQPPWNGTEEVIATVAPVFSTHYSELIFLSQYMSRSWVSFVHDRDPNHHGIAKVPIWPAYDTKCAKNVVFRAQDNQGGSYVEDDDFRQPQLRWWNAHWSKLRS
ncbi:alpha/beta-hydrolase [Lophium mytilinum]|uniref:Carboxylic ester hydrolase n=1 Tax=Lophium mytilinum TaxID=390894 RepID=A0A6A6R152_9PEZI|nr:alpha/beta-hydrolase [Lophium mytilinum]